MIERESDELKKYKKAAMEFIDAVLEGPRSISPRSGKLAKFIWMVDGSPCDVRRYAYSHQEAIDIVDHRGGLKGWNLYKLVRVNKRQTPSLRTQRKVK